jgi:hypothetical protein
MSVSNLLSPPAVINRFLYASVGDDNNGMDLTLLSALARQNVDAWQKAAELSLLPGDPNACSIAHLGSRA